MKDVCILTVFRDSFEAPMRHYLTMLFGRKITQMPIDEQLPGMDKTPRDFMLREQQHMRFSYGPGILGRLLHVRSQRWKPTPRFIIVDDGTSLNDVRELGKYILIRINRDNMERVYPFTIPNPNYVLSNKGPIGALEYNIEQLVKRIIEDA